MNSWVAKNAKRLMAEYPFLCSRDLDTSNRQNSIIHVDIPNGWIPLFLQLCEDVKEHINSSDEFYIMYIKEKFNSLVCFCSKTPKELENILEKYKYMSKYICSNCGKPAVYETSDYILSYCNDCWKDFVRYDKGNWLKNNESCDVIKSDGSRVSFLAEWTRYLEGLNI